MKGAVDKEAGNGGQLKAEGDIVAQFQTTRIRSMIGYNISGYKRIFQLAVDCALTLDPSNFTVTNTFPYSEILKVTPDPSDTDQFIVEADKTSYVYKTAFRSHLLCQFYECIAKRHPNKFKSAGPFHSQRLRKNGSRVENCVVVAPYGIVETDPTGRTLMEYSFTNVSRVGSDEHARAIFFVSSGRTKIFFVNDIQNILNAIRIMLQQIGLLSKVTFMSNQNVNEIIKFRNQKYQDCGLALATFDVNKVTRRSMRPMPRQMHVTEDFIVEKDLSGFQFVSFHKITSIYSIVRNWTSPREFTIEYDDGTSRTYTCAQRDTLLAMILDVGHALGNRRVIVTGEISDNLRLMPRHAEEDYQVSIKDAFFGASSIEAWFLSRLSKVCKPGIPVDKSGLEKACRELNANVACPGIASNSDPTLVKSAITGLLCNLNMAVIEDMKNDHIDHSRYIISMIQSLYRIVTSNAGYKSFVEVKEVDTRLLMIQLTLMGNDFINYWTLELLTMLCNSPMEPRKAQQEFVNKHTLLNDKMLNSLIELMSSRIDAQGNIINMGDEYDEIAEIIEEEDRSRGGSHGGNVPGLDKIEGPKVAANAGAYGHLPSSGGGHASAVVQEEKEHAPPTKSDAYSTASGTVEPTNWHPSALVIVSAAALLESVVTSRRDSSSPELLNTLLDLLKERCDVLINMLRSTSFLILENAAILMFVLLKNRPTVAPSLKEMALSEGLTIRHFYNAVYSPSSSQRFISRFLVATWMSGSQGENPGKALLKRVLPSGLVEYLKMEPLTEEHRKNLDAMEDEFYSNMSGQGHPQPAENNSSARTAGRGADLQVRMRRRLAQALHEAIVQRPIAVNSITLTEKEKVLQERSRTASSDYVSTNVKIGTESAPGTGGALDMDGEDATDDARRPSSSPDDGPALDRNAKPSGNTIATSRRARSGHTISVPTNDGPGSGKPENYRVMFHVMTQDHKMPDLIWNEQTRLELRTALETELKEYDRELRLRGATKVAWNYQQFTVEYPSLRDEMKVGAVYVRHFLEANDSFIVGLENPSHTVLFEKLFRRVLVNVGSQAGISILCTRCLTRLYATCTDKIGTFDDMMLTVRMLEQAQDMELQHCLLDLLNTLSLVDLNLHQLLDIDFVDVIIKYASLAHLNPDQIGNVLARATNTALLIKDSAPADKAKFNATHLGAENLANTGVSSAFSGTSGLQSQSEEEDSRLRKRSMWVPEDISCPKVWFVCPPGTIPPSQQVQKGPYRVSDLLDELDSGRLESSWYAAPSLPDNEDGVENNFGAHVDTGRWKPILEYSQLRMQMLFPGKAVYSPAQVAYKSLNMLYRLAAVHKSANSKGIAFYPIPVSKRIMSSTDHLSIFAQLLLCNNGDVVDIAASLIKGLVEYNPNANSKLYLTGVFFFACQYTGNNFTCLARLFEATHMQQAFHDQQASVAAQLPLSQRSVLGTILPTALISILVNYGHVRFASIFTGEFDTPEVIWNASLRRHVVEMVQQHLADFPGRLRQYNLSKYEYCPIPKIHFPDLDREVYVHEYYLRNLCDEVRFKNWPIAEPLELLRETIERWRSEMKKGVVDTSIRDAEHLLGLKEKFTNAELRKAYKVLAREYHPDKNPNGREMFENIHQAYELLSSIELKLIETDLAHVVLLLKTQNIIYRRYSTFVADQKYPAYKLLASVLRVPTAELATEKVSGVDHDLLLCGSLLCNLSVSISPLNAKEFVKCDAVPRLNEILTYALRESEYEVMVNILKAFTAVLQFDSGREAAAELCPALSDNMYQAILLDKKCPLAAENAMESVARGAGSADLQRHFVNSGIVWLLMPMLLSYDATCQADYTDESQRLIHNQKASNMHAIVAAKALGRLGGYMFEDLASPENSYVKQALSCLLTIPLAKLLRNRRPWDLLKALNENVESTTKIWNVSMRSELLDFVISTIRDRPSGTREDDLLGAMSFSYSTMRDELCIGGVYARIYNKVENDEDIDDPSQFCRDLLHYIWMYSKPSDDDELGPRTFPSQDHREMAVEALKNLSVHNDYIAVDIAHVNHGIENVYGLLSLPSESPAFVSVALLFTQLCGNTEFVEASVGAEPSVVWRLLKAMCEATGSAAINVFNAAEAFASIPKGLEALLDCGSITHLLGCLTGIAGHTSSFASRSAAIALISKFLWNPVRGPDASHTLRRFLPEPIVKALKNSAGAASLQVLDDLTENPELIWTAEMQSELRNELTKLFDDSGNDYSSPPVLHVDYHVPYKQLESELYIGGVYIRLYLKQPTFRLSNPVFFAEKLIEFWEAAFNIQVPPKSAASRGMAMASDDADGDGTTSTAVVLGSEDFLSLLTSSIVCVVKGEPSVIDHLLAWGFVSGLCDLLKRAMDSKRKGVPAMSIVRLMHQFVSRVDCVDSIANTDFIRQVVITLGGTGAPHNAGTGTTDSGGRAQLPKEAGFIVELLKKVYQCRASSFIGVLVHNATQADLPNFLLDSIIGASQDDLNSVLHPAALRIHAVDTIKAIIAADEFQAGPLQALLAVHPVWSEYKDQNHDLFITDQEKTDPFLIQDSTDKAVVGLLTDGSVKSGISTYFTSTGPPPPVAKEPEVVIERPTAPTNNSPLPVAPTSRRSNENVSMSSLAANPPLAGLATFASASDAATPNGAVIQAHRFIVTINKGADGLGLDIGKIASGGCMIRRLKDIPGGRPNPAAACVPALKAGDMIVGVNGQEILEFGAVVAVIKSLPAVATVTLLIERGAETM